MQNFESGGAYGRPGTNAPPPSRNRSARVGPSIVPTSGYRFAEPFLPKPWASPSVPRRTWGRVGEREAGTEAAIGRRDASCKPTGTGFAFVPSGLTRFCCALIFLLAASPAGLAATWTWSGLGGNSNWARGELDPGSAPSSAATTDLVFAGTNNTGTPPPAPSKHRKPVSAEQSHFRQLGRGIFSRRQSADVYRQHKDDPAGFG